MKDKVISLATEKWLRDTRNPKEYLEKLFINDALFGPEVMSRYREPLEPEERSQKPQKERAPSEPNREARLIPFPSKHREPGSSTS